MRHIDAELAKSKYLEVSELGSRYNLSFSSQLVLGHKIIALDGVKKLLLMVDADKEVDPPCMIDLNNVSAITIRKSYGTIKQGALRNRGIEEFLNTIDLQFLMKDKTSTIVLPVYDFKIDDQEDRKTLDKSAKNWQTILSKIIGMKPITKSDNDSKSS